MANSFLPTEVASLITQLACVLHATNAWRLQPLLVGMLFARGRLTVSSWLRAGELSDDYQSYYYFLGSLGRKVKTVAALLLLAVLRVVNTGDRLLFAIDDTPTKRCGPHVEGAGIHHNPTPGPADQKYLYGHVWVTLSLVVRHTLWGTIGLPLLAYLYVRQANLKSIPSSSGVKFQTKLEQAAALIEWLALWLRNQGKRLWVVADGAYAKRPFLKRAMKTGATVVSRLRRDAALRSVPEAVPANRRGRGRPRKYGEKRISLAKRAGHGRGWKWDTLTLYNKATLVCYKTFQATYQPAGGLIRVVIVREDDGDWRGYFCTDANASVTEVLEAVADRSAIEQNYHDLKEVHGAGQQQLRNYWANIAAWHLTMWLHTLIEMWAWNRSHKELVDRSASPWDDAERRPSHADRRNALRRSCLEQEYQREAAAAGFGRKTRNLWSRLLKLAA
jgi:hypothetical protein